jgi:hypothetical protein
MTRLTTLAKLRVPLGGQEIELQQVDFAPALESSARAATVDDAAACRGVPINLLRTRIREGNRFTIFDIDPDTAQRWGEALLQWAREQPRQ